MFDIDKKIHENLIEELENQFKLWLEKRNKKETKSIEIIIARQRIMFVADNVRWDFNYDYEASLVCELQKEAIRLSDTVDPNTLYEVLFFDSNVGKQMLVDFVNSSKVDEKILAKYYFDTSVVDSFVSQTIKEVLGVDKLRSLQASKETETQVKSVTSNHIQDIETDKASLEVYECGCGYHMGFDASFLEQVEPVVTAECPSCKNLIQTIDI